MRKIFVLVVFFIGVHSISAQQLWKKIDKANVIQQKQKIYKGFELPNSYQLFSFENNSFSNLSAKSTSLKRATIQLPDENGQISEFYIQKTQTLHPELAKKFPSIQSFKAVKVTDENVTARISLGVNGLNAVISASNKKPIIIKPFSKDKSQYIVYNKGNVISERDHFECEVLDVNHLSKKIRTSKKVNDGILRTYRIAIVATAEYSEFHLNREGVSMAVSEQVKKATVLSAINTSLTRVNEVFERELSVNFMLVADNDKIIYFDTATDGVSNGAVLKMIDECQVICDREIGNGNYDIGHVVSQGDDTGLAAGGTVCITGQKGRAVTSKTFPIGEAFDVDFFAHEIGHQFGALHSYNNSCDRNRNELAAVEPGSGSTIMSYAGICFPNVQRQVDDYFHTVSLTQMWDVIQSSATCATSTSNNNTAPTSNAGSDYSIPKGTPFVLKGSGADLENETSLTYNWEQIDREIATMPPVSSSDEGPTFRSLPAKSIPERYFPSLEDVVAGNSPEWEVLPTVARSLNFTLTVRDNNTSGGAFAKDDMSVTLTDAEPFLITSQNTSEVWDVGSTQTITWDVGSTNQSPINTQFVTIKLSTDGGKTFPFSLIESTVNDGTEFFVVPEYVSKNIRIMVMAIDNIFFDVNNVDLEIRSTVPTFVFTVENESEFVCNTGDEFVTYNLNLDFVNDFSESVSFSSSGLPDGVLVNFSPETITESGSILVTISNLNDVVAQNYPITFTASSASVTRNVNVDLSITGIVSNAVNLLLPTDGAEEIPVAAGLSWEENSQASSYLVEIATDENFTSIVTEASASINAFTALDLLQGTRYYWRVKPVNTCSEGDFSEFFSFRTQVCDVCASEGNTEFETSTTFVSFNTIANETPNKSSGYMDFTEISTRIARDSIYDLVVNANTADDGDGVFTTYSFVWIDWNQDCEFSEEETYNLGSTRGSVNGQTSLSPLQIKVPSNAILGNTIMRVTTKYDGGEQEPDFPSACEIGADAEVEDYTIIVDTVADTQNFNFNNFEMYPNPATNSFTIKFSVKNRSKLQVQIVDLRGRIVEEQSYDNLSSIFSREIQFDKKTPGMYFVRLINGDNVLVKRLVIN